MLGLLRASSQGATTRGVKYWTLCPGRSYRLVAEVVAVSEAGRLAALERAGLVHPRAEAVTAPLFSSGGFFLVAASFEQAGMAGLLDERRGRHGPVKLSGEITEFIRAAPAASGAVLAEQVAGRFGVVLHRRTIERARGR